MTEEMTKETGEQTNHFLDITSEVCPMTFVKTRLMIEKMVPGDVAEIKLCGEEPLENVPDSITELGHVVLGMEPEAGSSTVHILKMQKT